MTCWDKEGTSEVIDEVAALMRDRRITTRRVSLVGKTPRGSRALYTFIRNFFFPKATSRNSIDKARQLGFDIRPPRFEHTPLQPQGI